MNRSDKALPLGPVRLPSRETAALVESVKDYAILMLDPAGRVLTWNEGARVAKGWAADEILGQSFTRFYAPEDVDSGKPWRLLEEAALHGRVEDEGWRVRKDGSRFWADVVITAVRDERQNLTGYTKVVRDLTERRAAEEKLRQSEQRLRLLVESVQDYAFFMLTVDGHIASWNSGAQRTKGWTASEAIGRHMSIFYPPEAAAAGRPRELLALAASSGRVEDEGWRVRKDGTRFWADVIIARVDDDEGRLLGYSKITRDLTDRRAAEQALRESEERARLMIASVRDYAIFMLDPGGRVSTWNAGAERLKGYAAAEAIGQHFSVFYPEEDQRAGKPARELEIADGEGRYEEEGWRVRKDGSRFWANVVISAVRDGSGHLVGFTKVTRDESERRRAATLLEAHARQQAATAALGIEALRAPDPVATAEGVVRVVRQLLGSDLVAVLASEEGGLRVVAGDGWHEGTVGALVPADPDTLAGRAHATREPAVATDFAAPGGIGASGLALAHGARCGIAVPIPAHDPEAPPFGVLVALRREAQVHGPEQLSFLQGTANVLAAALARRHQEEQLRRAQLAAAAARARSEQAQREVQQRDEFISIAAHELRTPLNALQLNVQGLERLLGEDAPARARSRTDGALRQTRRLTQLVDRLLDVSRIAAGGLALTREPTDLTALAREVVESLRETASGAGSEVTFAASGPALGQWDRTRLEQVATNLVSNAIKYGAGKPIRVQVDGEGDRARLVVEDAGIGIAPEDVDRIFGRFERAVSVRHYSGLGLGLYVTRHLVEAHGGAIRVDSRRGEGSRFTVELPRHAEGDQSDVGDADDARKRS